MGAGSRIHARESDLLKLFLSDGDVVEHRLHVARVRQDVVVHLVEKSGNVNVPGPLPWIPLLKPDACAQYDALLEVVDAGCARRRRGSKANVTPSPFARAKG